MKYKTNSKKNSNSTTLVYHYFFLLFGFFGGNLWGSFFSSLCLPSFFLVIGVLLCLEILSYIYYKNLSPLTLEKKGVKGAKQRLFLPPVWKPKTTTFESQKRQASVTGNALEQSTFPFFTKTKKKFFLNPLKIVQNRNKSLYLLKVGLVLGLFVDAFKVGS